MSTQSTEIRTLGPGSIVSVEDMDPTHRALLMFLANKTANTRAAYEEDRHARRRSPAAQRRQHPP